MSVAHLISLTHIPFLYYIPAIKKLLEEYFEEEVTTKHGDAKKKAIIPQGKFPLFFPLTSAGFSLF